MTHKAKKGDKLVKWEFGHQLYEVTVVSRTKHTIATESALGFANDRKGRPERFRVYDAAKVTEIRRLLEESQSLHRKALDLYHDMEDIS